MLDKNKEHEIVHFKRDIIKTLYENPDIIELLNHPDVDPDTPDTAEWTAIFPYLKIPGIQEEVACYLSLAVDSVYRDDINPMFKEMQFSVWIVCAIDMLRIEDMKGIRTDLLADAIEESLNWNDTIGLTINTYDVREGVFENSKYYYRRIRMRAQRSNTIRGGLKPKQNKK